MKKLSTIVFTSFFLLIIVACDEVKVIQEEVEEVSPPESELNKN